MDNGAMENFFGRLKVEMFYGEKFGIEPSLLFCLFPILLADFHSYISCSVISFTSPLLPSDCSPLVKPLFEKI